ncbi:MAG: aminoacyl-tRNA hydrolase, partial [Hyphomicrobiales bacterium]
GIGHPGNKQQVLSWVLKDFSKADHGWLEPMIDGVARYADLLAGGDMPTFQNKVHLVINPETEHKPKNKQQASKPEAKPVAAPEAKEEKRGPLADMLKNLFKS